MKKDVIYVDIDDEITSITDKISKAKAPVIALVLPKRCPVLQSSVNIKILKRTTENIGKNLVLITSEASILPLAGTAGIYVAKTLQSKPAIPIAPDAEARQREEGGALIGKRPFAEGNAGQSPDGNPRDPHEQPRESEARKLDRDQRNRDDQDEPEVTPRRLRRIDAVPLIIFSFKIS